MKTKISVSVLMILLFIDSFSQIPAGFNYQAVARNASGEPIINASLPVTITIQSDSLGGTIFWKELHPLAVSDGTGVISLVVGKGTRQSGTVPVFTDIDWSISPKFIKTEIFYQSELKNLGSSRFWAVPYSFTASDISGSLDKLQVAGKTTSLSDALFEVKNINGQTVFAVYNEGVRVYVDDGKKGTKGGFAVSGFGLDKGPNAQQYLYVSGDSIRAYIGPTDSKVSKGGFAVSGFTSAKEVSSEQYLRVTRDSTRVYVNDASGKAVKGGFAVGSFSAAKTNAGNFLDLTPENYFIGHNAGASNTTGLYNSFFGYKAGQSNTEGIQNIFIGHLTGINNTTGDANLFIGDSAGFSNTTGNINVLLGGFAGAANTTGYQNINVGYCAGLKNISGNRNIAIGTAAAQDNTTGFLNVSIGNFAGAFSLGNQNTYIGSRAGLNNVNGSRNVFIGYEAGRDETNSNRLYIANTYLGTPLIYGEFDNGRVVINGNSTQNTSERTLFVNGSAGGLEAWYNDSDRDLKHNIFTIPDALEKVMKIRGVNFMWNDPGLGMGKLQMGFIGQEAAEVVPEVVAVKDDHYTMQYAPLTALLVEAVKEQQKMIEEQQKQIEELKALVGSLIAE